MMTILAQANAISAVLSSVSKFIKPFVGIWAFWLIMHKKNIDKGTREKQILAPVYSAVYCVVSLIGGIIFFQKFDIAKYWNIFRTVGNTLLGMIKVKPIIPMFSGGQIVYLNIALVTLFAVAVKPIILKICLKKMDCQEYIEDVASNFYEYSLVHGAWFLMPEWRGFQRMMAVLAKVSIFASAGLLGFSWVYEAKTGIVFCIFPYILVILFEEISNALDGYTLVEYESTIDGDDAVVSARAGAFQKILSIYENKFPNQILSSHNGTKFSKRIGPIDYLEELAQSENQEDQLASHFFYQQNKARVPLDVDYMSGTVKLLHGENVIFSNPFYRDLSKYVLLPLIDAMVKGHKCVVLIGNRDLKEDIVSWVREMIEDYAKVSCIWRVETLNNSKPDCDIGILDFPSLYDTKILRENAGFFREVSLCVLVETSNMIPTAQIGLNIVVNEMNCQLNPPVYCIIDRTSDGLVDTFSHALQTNITNVIAAPVPRCAYTAVAWDAAGDYQRQCLFEKETRFLGNGVELAAVAVKNQIPKVTWYGGRKSPVRDIEWIVGQYYSQIAQYIHSVRQQTTVAAKFEFVPNGWQATKTDERFLIAEDEYCNMYEALRMYLSRGEKQSFVNVMADSYLLRDYMRYNMQIFMSDPKAIPSILPDYARTERNMIIQLILRMASGTVREREIAHDFTLQGIETVGMKSTLQRLISKYTLINADVVIEDSQPIDPNSPASESENVYSISPLVFDELFINTIKNAYYVVEDEKLNKEYIDAKMYGLLTQCILPGQFIVSDGKYYQVESISPNYGALLRRASDRYDKRECYRQLRRYYFEPDAVVTQISTRKVMDIEVTFESRNFRVLTEGYLDMDSYHDLKNASVVDFKANDLYKDLTFDSTLNYRTEPARHPFERAYHNKTVLRISLPNSSKDMRNTLAMLLQEVFRTIYPDNWQYLAVLSDKDEKVEGLLSHMTYSVENMPEGNGCDIIIVEDSDLDLGLLESIDHNLKRILEIITDYLYWHFEKIKEGTTNKTPAETTTKEELIAAVEKANEKGLKKTLKKLGGIFGKKKNKQDKKSEGKKKTGENTPERSAGDTEYNPENDKEIEDNIERITGEDALIGDAAESSGISSSDSVSENVDETGEESEKPKKKGLFGKKTKEERLAEKEKKKKEKEEKKKAKEKKKAEKNKGKKKWWPFGKKSKGKNQEGDGTEEEEFPTDITEDDTTGEDNSSDDTSSNETGNPDDINIPDWESKEAEEGVPEFVGDDLKEKEKEDDLFIGDGMQDDFEDISGFMPLDMTEYQKNCYLKFGFNEIDDHIVIDDLKKYLTFRGLGDNPLMLARTRVPHQLSLLDFDSQEETCDFCGIPLSGVSYDQLIDGRTRCNDCAASAIDSVEEFRRLFEEHVVQMQENYRIKFNKPITVKMTDAKTISKGAGSVYNPGKKFTARVVGYAQNKRDKYNLFIENGSPRLACIETMIHEMTHIWQYINWDSKKFETVYGKNKLADVIIHEGMAVWVATQYLYFIGENAYAQMQEDIMDLKLVLAIREARNQIKETGSYDITDPYCFGFKLYKLEYNLARNMDIPKNTPFNAFPPLKERKVLAVINDMIINPEAYDIKIEE